MGLVLYRAELSPNEKPPVAGGGNILVVATLIVAPRRVVATGVLDWKKAMDEITEADRRFLDRVETITFTPGTGEVVALDQKGKKLRLSKATFQRLKASNLIFRSSSSLTTDTYVPHGPQIIPVTAETAGVEPV